MKNTDINKITKEGLYIPSIEACWLYKINKETGDYEVDEKYLDKMLNGKLDYSHELVMNNDFINGIKVMKSDGKLYTLDVVNVKYNKKYKEIIDKKVVSQMGTKKLRDYTYQNGFDFNGKHMDNWKRSGGKAREGDDLYIMSDIKDKCLAWARMDLEFKGDNIDIAGLRAYESLSLSSIIGTIEINPKNILVIDDYKSKFTWDMSKTWLVGKELKTKTMPVEESNSIWDGQGMLTKKIFEKNEFIKGKGVALLRNRYMKCAGFSVDLELFYTNYCNKNNLDYDTFKIDDMYGNSIKIKDIELITTPSAIKLAKYNNKVLEEKPEYEKYGKSAWLQYWKDNCGKVFSVCKTEKPSYLCKEDENGNIIYKNRLSYQFVNTIPFESDTEIKDLLSGEIEYINKLKNDLEFFLQEVNQEQENIEIIEDDNDEDNELEIGSNMDVTSAFVELVKTNPLFQNTQVFKDYRRNFITSYINKLRQGKVLIDSDYSVACGNGMEMLKATIGEFDGTSELKDNELYCSRFDDGDDVVGFRNPSVNVGNIGIQKNKVVENYKSYFNCTGNIVHLNSINYPILSTYQGEDYDIDCNLLTVDSNIVKPCARIDKTITPIPFNAIENTGSNNAELNGKNMADIDHKIAQNYIGSVINLSQEIHSLYNHKVNNKSEDVDELKSLYDMTSCLSSISQCEIDKAKKQFQALDVPSELEKRKTGLRLVDEDDITKINKDIDKIKTELSTIKDIVNEHRKDKRKPILKEIRNIKKELELNKDDKSLQDKISELEQKIKYEINLERQNEIDAVKNKLSKKFIELQKYDSRRIKPYFMKFVGDTEAKKQRIKTNKKHRKQLDQPIIKKYCKDNDIKILDKKDKKLQELLKVNDNIQKEWEDKIYDKTMDTPMNWLNLELDKIKNSKKIGTVQVIQLVKKNKHKANEEVVNYVTNNIKNLDTKIKAYKLNTDLTGKDKLNKIRFAKKEVVKNIKYMKLNKTDMYGVMKECLNSCKKNGKVDKKTGIESLSLEILFSTYGTGLLNMFCKNIGGDSNTGKHL